MKVFALIVGWVVTSAVLLGLILFMLLGAPQPDPAWMGIVGAAVGLLLYAGVALGVLRASSDIDGSAGARVGYGRVRLGLLIADGVVACALAGYSVAVGAPWWIPAAGVAVGVVFVLGAAPIGDALRRRVLQHPRSTGSRAHASTSSVAIHRRALSIVYTFAITLVIGIVGVLTLTVLLDEGADIFGDLVFSVVAVALFAAGVAALIASVSMTREVRVSAGGDVGRMRRFARVVLRGAGDELGDDEMSAVREYARLISASLGFQLAYVTLLYAGLAELLVARIIADADDAGFARILCAVLVVVYVVAFRILVVRIRRARRYREAKDAEQATVTG